MRQCSQDEAGCQSRYASNPNSHALSSPPAAPDHIHSSGDRIVVVVQKQRNFGPESGANAAVSISAANKVRRGDIRHAVIVRTAKKYQRPDGSVVKFDDNACVLINKSGDPIGSRLNGKKSPRYKLYHRWGIGFEADRAYHRHCGQGVAQYEMVQDSLSCAHASLSMSITQFRTLLLYRL